MNRRMVSPVSFRSFQFLVALVAFGMVLVPLAYAKKFWRASLGPVDIYTSDSPDNTKNFLSELLEVRRQVELLNGAPLPNPRMQVVVFGSRADYQDFLPKGSVKEKDMESVSGFTHGEFGLTVAVSKEAGFGYQFGKDAVLFFYAQYLIGTVVPNAPLWMRTGLAEVLAGTECRRNRIYLGSDFMEHNREVRASKLISLDSLMDDEAMRYNAGAPKHDTVLYHESWALWHQWLTAEQGNRRAQITRLFAALRNGAPGNFSTVAAAFEETKAAIESAHRTRPILKALKVIEVNPDAASLLKNIEFKPATDLDEKFALAMVFSRTGKGLGVLGFELLQLAEKYPTSPRPMEAMAALAMGDNDTENALLRWERARELGTDNPYAYLVPARRRLDGRQFRLSGRAQLPEGLTAELRESLAKAAELSPGSMEVNFYRALVEAFAPQPQKDILDAIDETHSLETKPIGQLYLAMARWRTKDQGAAEKILARTLARPNLKKSEKSNIEMFQSVIADKETEAN